eukprot:GAFH01000307.1.p1 GENE.GAFH01000307.1~~GAFH01000307.1.p1  ORF type:complete len:354 (+),score=39.14 GAFH01000307.1:22-1062(+)
MKGLRSPLLTAAAPPLALTLVSDDERSASLAIGKSVHATAAEESPTTVPKSRFDAYLSTLAHGVVYVPQSRCSFGPDLYARFDGEADFMLASIRNQNSQSWEDVRKFINQSRELLPPDCPHRYHLFCFSAEWSSEINAAMTDSVLCIPANSELVETGDSFRARPRTGRASRSKVFLTTDPNVAVYLVSTGLLDELLGKGSAEALRVLRGRHSHSQLKDLVAVAPYLPSDCDDDAVATTTGGPTPPVPSGPPVAVNPSAPGLLSLRQGALRLALSKVRQSPELADRDRTEGWDAIQSVILGYCTSVADLTEMTVHKMRTEGLGGAEAERLFQAISSALKPRDVTSTQ